VRVDNKLDPHMIRLSPSSEYEEERKPLELNGNNWAVQDINKLIAYYVLNKSWVTEINII